MQVALLKFTPVDGRKIFRVKIHVLLRVFIGFVTDVSGIFASICHGFTLSNI